jgi:uncharacterized protein
MPEYLYPGVYVEEVDTGNEPIEGVSTSTVGFLGFTERGTPTPTFITSYTQFVRTFGGPVLGANGLPSCYLAYAIQGFFQNGGLRCWVARVTSNSSVAASDTSLPEMTVTAAGPGSWGGQVGYLIGPASLANSNLFQLTVIYWSSLTDAQAQQGATNIGTAISKADLVETYDNLSADPSSSTYYVAAVNGASNLVTLTQNSAAVPTTTGQSVVLLANASDGAGVSGLVLGDFEGLDSNANPITDSDGNPVALPGLGMIGGISLLCCPDESLLPAGVIADQLNLQCTTLLDRFAILQSLPQAGQPANVTPPSTITGSQYCAFYYPWLYITDPISDNSILIPPGGHIAGIYARSDTNRSVAKDPANEPILGIDSIQLKINDQTQGVLNPLGVNCLRYFSGRGNLVWGGRTTSSDPDWKYISVRRLFIFVEQSIKQGTQQYVFEPNDQTLWARVVRSVSDFLTGLWSDGMLQGAKKEEAFFVRCDQTTMSQADIDNGKLIMIIGIAPVQPAEFVIFQIGQWDGGSSVTES